MDKNEPRTNGKQIFSSIKSKIDSFWDLIMVFFAIFSGIGVGFLARKYHFPLKYLDLLGLPGDMFFNFLQAIIVFFVMSLILFTAMRIKDLDNIALIVKLCAKWTLITSIIVSTISTAITVPSLLNVSKNLELGDTSGKSIEKGFFENIIEMIGKALPDNIFKAQADGNLLAIVCIFMILGYYFSKHDDKKDGSEGQMFQMVSIFYETISSIVNFFMYFTSFAVFAIIAKNVALIKDLDGLVSIYPLAYTFIGSIVACFFVYCVLCGVVIQKNPFQILKEYKDPIVTAISTSSSATALSQMIIVGKNRHPNYEKETNFIMTMLSTFQMSGSAVYFTVVTIFVAVMNGKPLDFGHYIILAIVVIMVTIANSPVPLSVIVFLNVVCNSIGVTVSTRLQSVLITFDCFLDRLITTLNVIGGIFTFEIVFALYTKQNPQVKKYVSTTIDNDPAYVFY